MNSKSVRIVAVLSLLVALMTISTPSGAGLKDDIAKLKDEQKEVRDEKSEQAKTIDAATAEVTELTDALKVLNEQVNAQQARINAAESVSAQTKQRGESAKSETVAIQQQIEELESELAELAIDGFQARNIQSGIPGLDGQDSSEAVAKSRFSQTVTRSELETTEELRRSKAALETAIAQGSTAEAELAKQKKKLTDEQKKLQAARDAQAKVAQQAEDRLENELAEAAVLDGRDEALANSIREKNNPVAQQTNIATRNTKPTTSGPVPAAAGPPSGKIVKITTSSGQKIEVDSSIAPNVQAMFDASAAAGLNLGGWGYRSAQRQIELRIQNCGGNNNFAIYQKRSSTCRPPTARPGRSNHERGLAIDITSGRSTIKSRNTPAFRWLQANASKYGLKNLPSEPWHWSVNGN